MFEQSMVVSQATRLSTGARWTWAGSISLQCCTAALLIAVPLLHPERLVLSKTAPKTFVPLPMVKPLPVKVLRTEASSSTTHLQASTPSAAHAFTSPVRIPQGISVDKAPPMSVTGGFGEMAAPLPEELANAAEGGTRVSVLPGVHTDAREPVRVSSGVGAGMLITPVRPIYPQIAKAARVEGSVVIEAVISREGRIERARVVTGPSLLVGAALAAVEAARYTPYRLNGTALEVETTITVNFRLGG